jgi:hypothetical protein
LILLRFICVSTERRTARHVSRILPNAFINLIITEEQRDGQVHDMYNKLASTLDSRKIYR